MFRKEMYDVKLYGQTSMDIFLAQMPQISYDRFG